MKQSVSEQLQYAKQLIVKHLETIDTITKEKEQQKSSHSYYEKLRVEAEKELESVHTLLDALPGTIARKTTPPGTESWNVVTNSVMTRLCTFLATR